MRVEVHPADRGACGGYRVRWAAEALAAQGEDVQLGGNLTGIYCDQPDGPELLGVNPPDADVVVLQRVLRREVADLIPHLQALGIAVVVEIDDDFHTLPDHNPARQESDPDRNAESNREILKEACRRADVVTCSTPALRDRYGHGHGVVIPNYARARWLELEPVKAVPPSVGWTGVWFTHRGDIPAMGPVVLPDGWRFRNIGSDRGGRRVREGFGIPPDRFDVVPWLDLHTDEYPLGIGALSVGVVPLEQTMFNQAKSALKGTEYAACGVPFVASDTADYRRLAKHGIGVLARSRREWAAQLARLTTEEAYREDLAHTGRERMAGLTIEGNLDRWWEAWTLATKRRAKKG